MEEKVMTFIKRNSAYYPGFQMFFDKRMMGCDNWNYSGTNTSIPAVNVKEDVEKYEIEVAAPGMKKEDFRLKIENNILIISSEFKNEDVQNVNYSRREFSFQSFERRFNIPERHIEQENISATYTNGILVISLPKKEEAKPQPPKDITIS